MMNWFEYEDEYEYDGAVESGMGAWCKETHGDGVEDLSRLEKPVYFVF